MKEHQKARAWRDNLGLTREGLAERIGYSVESIRWFELGVSPPRGKGRVQAPFPEWVWLRYRRACQGLQAELDGRAFKW